MDVFLAALGGSVRDSRAVASFFSDGAAARRAVARAADAFSRSASDLSGRADGRHRKVAGGGEFRRRAVELRGKRAMLYERTFWRVVPAVDHRRRRRPASG